MADLTVLAGVQQIQGVAGGVAVPVTVDTSVLAKDATLTGGTQKAQRVDASGNVAPAGDTAAHAQFVSCTDGTNTMAVKPASTPCTATDPAGVVTIHPLSPNVGGQYHATTPSKTNSDLGPLEVSPAGNAYVGACARYVRKLSLAVAGATSATNTFGLLPEGACDAFCVDTDNVIVFKQPPERAWMCVNGDFASGTNWPNIGNWTVDTAHHKATCTAGATTALVQTTLTANPNDPVLVGQTYLCVYTLTRSAGSVQIGLGTALGAARSSSGTYLEAITAATTGNISFSPSADFAGSVSAVYVIPATLPVLAGQDSARSAVLIAGVATVAAPTVLVSTVAVQGVWYRRRGAVEITALLTAAS